MSDPLSASQEAAMGAAMSAYMDLSAVAQARITATLRREDTTRFARRLAAYRALEATTPCDEHRSQVAYYKRALAQAEAEEAAVLAVLVGGRRAAQ